MPEAALELRSPYGLHGVFLGSRAASEGFASRRQLTSGVCRRLLKDVYADPRLTADHRLVAHGALRLARLVAAGWRVIRLAAHDLRDMDAVVARIAHEVRTAPSRR